MGNNPSGTLINPVATTKYVGRLILSIDWHQVLDICRTTGGNIHPDEPYTLIERYRRKLVQIKQHDSRIVLVVNSYTCAPYYRDSVHSLAQKYPGLFDHIVTTSDRTSRGGKAQALSSFCSLGRCCIVHFDDQKDVLDEFAGFRQFRLDQGWRTELNAVGISVLKKAESQRCAIFSQPRAGTRSAQLGLLAWANPFTVIELQ